MEGAASRRAAVSGRLCVEPMLRLRTGFDLCPARPTTNSRPCVKPAAHQGWFALPYIVAEGWCFRRCGADGRLVAQW